MRGKGICFSQTAIDYLEEFFTAEVLPVLQITNQVSLGGEEVETSVFSCKRKQYRT